MKEVSGPRGPNAIWPGFLFNHKGIKVQHKSNKGFVDLEFSDMKDHIQDFSNYIKPFLDSDMKIEKTGKSVSIRLHVPFIDFHEEFSDYISELHLVLGAVSRFYVMYDKIDMSIIDEIKRKDVKYG